MFVLIIVAAVVLLGGAFVVTINYDRPKIVGINDTPMITTLLVAEKPDSPAAIGGAGSTGELDMRVQADADESGGADVQDLYKVETVPTIVVGTGAVNLKVTVTPILGDGTEGTPVITNIPHNETMDAWQSAAGRARQT